MSENPNLELARRVWQAIAHADVETLKELWTEDIVWHVTDQGSPWTGDHVGHEAVLDYLAQVGEFGEAYRAHLDDILVSKERILYVCHVSAQRDDRDLETPYGFLARISDGRMAEAWSIPLQPDVTSAFYGRS